MEPIVISSRDFQEEDGCGKRHSVLLKKALIAPDSLVAVLEVGHASGWDGE